MKKRIVTCLSMWLTCMALHTLAVDKINVSSKKQNENLIENAGFDKGTQGWTLPTEGKYFADDGHEKKGSIVVINTNEIKRPYAVYSTAQVAGGYDYTFSAWVKFNNGQPKLKIEWYDKDGKDVEDIYSLTGVPGIWSKIELKVRAPQNAVRAMLFLRLFGTGEVYFDDVAFSYADPALCDFKIIPNVIYNSNNGYEAKALITFNTDDTNKILGMKAEIEITDDKSGNKVYAAEPISVEKNEFAHKFILTKQGAFTASIRVIDSQNNERYKTNYKFVTTNIPLSVKNGYYEIDGKPFFPIGAYHVAEKDFKFLKEGGFNAAQGFDSDDVLAMSNYYNRGLSYGIRFAFPLYRNMKVKENYANSREKMQAFKNHKAIYTYLFMDEPDAYCIPIPEMVGLRQILNENDSVRSAASVLFPTSKSFEYYASTVDVVSFDPYPKIQPTALPITMVREWIERAKKANKPMVPVIQAFAGNIWLEPTPSELENYVYQSLVHGAVGIYYYSFSDPSWYLPDTNLWASIKEINKEIAFLAPILLSEPMRKATWNVQSNPDVDWVMASIDKETYVIAVSIDTNKSTTLSIPVPSNVKGNITPLFNRGKPLIKDGRIIDEIEPLGTRIYVIK